MIQIKLTKRFLSLALAVLAVIPASAQECYMVMEAHSGKVLLATNSTTKRPIASLTKIATAVVAVDWATAAGKELANEELTVPPTISLVGGSNAMNLQPGDRMTLRDALYASMLGSDNLAALTIADHVGKQLVAKRGKGTDPVAEFVGEMNLLAKALGMTDTRFANPHGLERPGTKAYSTAADVARLSVYTMRRNALNFIVSQKTRKITVKGPEGDRYFTITNTNELVGEEGIHGIKTGTNTAAGPCLAACSELKPLVRDKPDGSKGVTPRRLIVVVLNSPDRFNRARGLIAEGWKFYDSWISNGAPVKERQREIISVPIL